MEDLRSHLYLLNRVWAVWVHQPHGNIHNEWSLCLPSQKRRKVSGTGRERERDMQGWADVFFGICICSEQDVYSWHALFLLCRHISPKRLFLILLQTVDTMSQLLLQLRSVLKLPLAVLSLFLKSVHLGASVLYLASFIWTSLNFLLINRNPSDYGLIPVLVSLVLWYWSWLCFFFLCSYFFIS